MAPKREPGESKVTVAYIPHGVNHNMWHRITESETEAFTKVKDYRKLLFGNDADKIKFVVLYNNRNIRRKMTSDVILAYQKFLQSLPLNKREECRLLMHTQPVDENGTDLPAVLKEVAPDVKATFSAGRLSPEQMVYLYNNIDVVINLASNEGFGIGTLEGMMSERMFIANVTGGLQDQMGFIDENGKYLDPQIHYNKDWGSNSNGKYKMHGEWCIPVFPNNRALIGSPQTPFIFDDRCDWNDAAEAIRKVYDFSPEERERRGKLGREWAMTSLTGMTTDLMCDRFENALEDVFTNWKPRKKFGLYKSE